jgi:predicted kinase
MTLQRATLHMMCGKIAAGKSTLSAKLATLPQTVKIGEDQWISHLYPGIASTADYFRHSERLRGVLAPHVVGLLLAGVSVVLDFHANTVRSRSWMRALFEEAKADHRLHFLDVPDEVCRARLHARNAAATDPYTADDAVFDEILRHFVPPHPSENFNVIRYGGSSS